MSETSSSVWKFFKKVNDDGSICQICMRTAKNKGCNTSNLAMHLRRNHPMQYATINPKRKVNSQASKETDETVGFPSSSQPTIKSAFYKTTPFESSNQRYQAITDAITQFLCKVIYVCVLFIDKKNRFFSFFRFFLDGFRFRFFSRTAPA